MSTTLFKKLFLFWFVLLISGSLSFTDITYATSCISWVKYELLTNTALLEIIISPYSYLYGIILLLLILSILQLCNKKLISSINFKVIRFIIAIIIITYFLTQTAWWQEINSPFIYDPYWLDCHWTISIYKWKDVLPEFMKRFSVIHLISGLLRFLYSKKTKKALLSQSKIINP